MNDAESSNPAESIKTEVVSDDRSQFRPSQEPSVTEAYVPQEVDRIAELCNQEISEGLPFAQQAAMESPPQESGVAEIKGEDTIDAYMAKLLARVSGVSPETSTQGVDQPKDTGPESPIEEANVKVVDPSEMVRQSVRAPEGRDDLANLRKVANASAHCALRTHDCKQLIQRMRRQLIVAFGSAVLSCGLVLFTATSTFYFAAVVFMLIGLVAGAQFLLKSQQLSHGLSAIISAPPSQNDHPADVPVALPEEPIDSAD